MRIITLISPILTNQTFNIIGLFNFVKSDLQNQVGLFVYLYLTDKVGVLIYIMLAGLLLFSISFLFAFFPLIFWYIRNRNPFICYRYVVQF